MSSDLTYKQACNAFYYSDGNLYWKVSQGTRKAGTIIGTKDTNGYHQVQWMRKLYLVHRIVWLLHYGEWPKDELDHIDGNPTNNNISNLRACTHSENMRNLPVHRKGKLPGAHRERSGNWRAHMTYNGKTLYLGMFSTMEAAHEAFKEAHKTYAKL